MVFPAPCAGGKTLSPAAVTGWQVEVEKFPVSTIPRSALAVVPSRSVIVRTGVAVSREAELPSWRPVRLTAETPG